MSTLSSPLAITGIYAALIALVFVVGEAVAGGKRSSGLDFTARMRRRSEHVPFALLLMIILELGGSSPALLHGMGSLLLVARTAAPLAGIARLPVSLLERIGVFVTVGVTCVAALLILVRAVSPSS